jgi:hypothetical protein
MKALSLRPILAPTLANLPGQMVRAVAFVGFKCFNQAFWNRARAIDETLFEFRD